jgi:S-adenosylmethionine:tRNA ribosyltransferase-isomerase
MKTSLAVQDLEYELPQGLIATEPATPRSSAKLLVVEKETFSHTHVCDLQQLLPTGALLVLNETSVLPARFMTERADTGGKGEGLFLSQDDSFWVVMLKSNGKLREGIELEIGNSVRLTLVERDGKNWRCACNDPRSAQEILLDVGITPIPPYILSARGEAMIDDAEDRARYQTVYADETQKESVAAPTAGLHFDAELLAGLDASGIERVNVTLHVGAGTFKGIETETIEAHEMHEEAWEVRQSALDSIRVAKRAGRAVIAIGTTSVRTLESLPPIKEWPKTGGLSGKTRLMIAPPYEFKVVDGLLTNFHLPKSTLLTLVAGMIGIERLKTAYTEAIESGYRFYSYGDAMFILPQESKV